MSGRGARRTIAQYVRRQIEEVLDGARAGNGFGFASDDAADMSDEHTPLRTAAHDGNGSSTGVCQQQRLRDACKGMSEPGAVVAAQSFQGWLTRVTAVLAKEAKVYVWVQGLLMSVTNGYIPGSFEAKYRLHSVSILDHDGGKGRYSFVCGVRNVQGEGGETVMSFRCRDQEHFMDWFSVLYGNCFAVMNNNALLAKAADCGRLIDRIGDVKPFEITVGMLRFIRQQFPRGEDDILRFLAQLEAEESKRSFGARFARDTQEQKDRKKYGKLMRYMQRVETLLLSSGVAECGGVETVLTLDLALFPSLHTLRLRYLEVDRVIEPARVKTLHVESCVGSIACFSSARTLVVKRCEKLEFDGLYEMARSLETLEVHSFLQTEDLQNILRVPGTGAVSAGSLTRRSSSPALTTLVDSGAQRWANLHSLDLSHNLLTSLPSELSQLRKLKTLILDYNDISSLRHVRSLKQLVHLSVSHNNVDDAEEAYDLKHLTVLNLSTNRLTAVNAFSGLTNLLALDVSHNNITDWRDVFSLSQSLTRLESLHLEGNPLQYSIAKSVRVPPLSSPTLTHPIAHPTQDYVPLVRTMFSRKLLLDGRKVTAPDRETMDEMAERCVTPSHLPGPLTHIHLLGHHTPHRYHDRAFQAKEAKPVVVQVVASDGASNARSRSSDNGSSRPGRRTRVVRKKIVRKKSGPRDDKSGTASKASPSPQSARAEEEAGASMPVAVGTPSDSGLRSHDVEGVGQQSPEDKMKCWSAGVARVTTPPAENPPTPDPVPEDDAEEASAPQPPAAEAVVADSPKITVAVDDVAAPLPEHTSDSPPGKKAARASPPVHPARSPRLAPERSDSRASSQAAALAAAADAAEAVEADAAATATAPAPAPEASDAPIVTRERQGSRRSARSVASGPKTAATVHQPQPDGFRRTHATYEDEQDAPTMWTDVRAHKKHLAELAKKTELEVELQKDEEVAVVEHAYSDREAEAEEGDESAVDVVLTQEMRDFALKVTQPARGLCWWLTSGFLYIFLWYQKYWRSLEKREWATLQKVLVVVCHVHLVLVVPFAIVFSQLPCDGCEGYEDRLFRYFISMMILCGSAFQTLLGIYALFYESEVMLVFFNLLTLMLATRYIFNMVNYLDTNAPQIIVVAPPIFEIAYELFFFAVSCLVWPHFNRLVFYRVGGGPHLVKMYKWVQIFAALARTDLLFISLSAIIAGFWYIKSAYQWVLMALVLMASLVIYNFAISWVLKENRRNLLFFVAFALAVFGVQFAMMYSLWIHPDETLRAHLKSSFHATVYTVLAALVVKVLTLGSLAQCFTNFEKGLKEALEDEEEEVMWGVPTVQV